MYEIFVLQFVSAVTFKNSISNNVQKRHTTRHPISKKKVTTDKVLPGIGIFLKSNALPSKIEMCLGSNFKEII